MTLPKSRKVNTTGVLEYLYELLTKLEEYTDNIRATIATLEGPKF